MHRWVSEMGVFIDFCESLACDFEQRLEERRGNDDTKNKGDEEMKNEKSETSKDAWIDLGVVVRTCTAAGTPLLLEGLPLGSSRGNLLADPSPKFFILGAEPGVCRS